MRQITDGVPPELALDHPYSSLVVQILERADGVDWRDLEAWFEARTADIFDTGLHEFLTDFKRKVVDISIRVSQTYLSGAIA